MPLFAREQGPADGPTLVLLHGGGVSSWSWALELERLADVHVLAPDLPEHGQSGGLLETPAAAQAVADLIRERAHGGQAYVAGLSLGSQVTLQLLATAPERVHSAFLSGTFVLSLGQRSPYANPLFRRLLAWTIAAYMPFRNAGWLVRANRKSYRIPTQFEAQFAEDTRRMTTGFFLRMLDANQAFAMPPGVERAQMPVLAVAGEQEPKEIHRSLRQIAAAIPFVDARVVQGVWHNWPLEDPDLYVATLRAWMSGAPLPERLKVIG
jgi:pimeloyl-ACP methyl ester carboxylesterase